MSPPLWLTTETSPGRIPSGTGWEMAQMPSWNEANPTQFGPTSSTSRPAHTSTRSRSRWRPSSVPVSRNPFEMTTMRVAPASIRSAQACTTCRAPTATTPISGGSGSAATDGWHVRPSSSSRRGLTSWIGPA